MANLNQSKGSRLSDSNINTFLPVGTSDDTLLDSYQNGLTFGDSGAQTAETFSGNGTTTGQFRYPRWNPHIITGVAALHDRGITGRGISVGIVDSGIYYLSEPLGGGVGSGYKVLGGYNLVGDIFSPDFQDQADFPANYDITDCNGHGTHIAGIIAGSESDNFVGVAPDANLRAYKVFGCSGSASDDTIIEAMLLAFQDRNDVISMSLGVDGVMFSGNPLAEVAARINEVGIFVAVSAGNTGNFGPFFGNGLGVGSQVTAVGASVSGQYIIYEAIARSSSGETFQFAFAPVGGLQPNTTGTFRLQLYNQAACSLAGSIPENVNNQPIALIFPQSSDCGDNQFYYSVSTLGYAVVFSYTRPAVQYTSSSVYPGPDHNMYDPIAIRGSVLGDLPEWAQSQISAGYTVDLVFQQSSMVPRTLFSQESLDQIQISRYTGMGPNYSGGLFPQIAAPGSNIYSTFLNDSFAVMTGTSMSTPYIAGVAALYLSSLQRNRTLGDDTARELHQRLLQTSSPLPFALNFGSSDTYAAPLIQQGFGFVNATRLVDTRTLITSDPTLILGISSQLQTRFNVTLYNGNNYTVQYRISHNPATTTFSKRPDNMIPSYFPPFINKFAAVTGDTGGLALPPGGMRILFFDIVAPETVPAIYGPVYQGKISIEGNNGEQVSAAYIGTYVDSYKSWSNTHQPLLLVDAIRNATILDSTVDGLPIINNGLDSLIYSPFLIGATEVDAVLVPESFTLEQVQFPLQVGLNGVIDFLNGFPSPYTARSLSGAFFSFQITSNTTITDGNYRVLVSVLPGIPDVATNTSDPNLWQTFLSEPFQFVYSPNATTTGRARGGHRRHRMDEMFQYHSDNEFITLPETGLQPRQNRNPMRPLRTSPVYQSFNSSIFTAVDLTSLNANYSMGFSPYDSMQITLELNIAQSLRVGQSASITIAPEFTDFPPPFPVYNDIGEQVLTVSIDPRTNILTASVIQDWNVVYISGSIIFTAFLKNPEQYTSDQLLPVTFVKESLNEGNVLVLDMALVDTYFPSIQARVYATSSAINVYIPATFRNWENMQITVTSAYQFGCSSITIQQTSELEGAESLYSDFVGGNINCANNLAVVSIPQQPSTNSSLRISIPANTPSAVVNSVVGGIIRCDYAGSPFTYYLSTVLNSISLRSNAMSLSGRRL